MKFANMTLIPAQRKPKLQKQQNRQQPNSKRKLKHTTTLNCLKLRTFFHLTHFQLELRMPAMKTTSADVMTLLEATSKEIVQPTMAKAQSCYQRKQQSLRQQAAAALTKSTAQHDSQCVKSTVALAQPESVSYISFWRLLSHQIPQELTSVGSLSWLLNCRRWFHDRLHTLTQTHKDFALQFQRRPCRLHLLLIVLVAASPCAECFHGSVKLSANTVKTKYGLLRGIVVRSAPLVEAYLGIPYASPPVGSLRFMPPITPSTWKNVRNADRFSPVCPQTVPIPPNGPEALLEVPRARLAQLRRLLPLLKNQSEDCLYLNIYVPFESQRYKRECIQSGQLSETTLGHQLINDSTNYSEKDDSPQLSTIVFIQGESFGWSSGNPYDGSELAAHGNVIVVTINFRLGILGFLKTGGKESAQGNFGLMDLVAGLHWLKENLPSFGGDPQSITLMGYGTGAVLANILTVSPVASDLVQRTVLISGSALSPWAIQRNPLFIKRRVAEQTGCHGDMLYDDLAPCLRTKSISELLAVKVDHPRFLVGFAPFVDGTVISLSTDSIGTITLPLGSAIVSTSGIEYANFPKRDLIFCLTSVESYLDLSAQDLEFGFNETRRDRILRTFVRNNFHYHLNEIYAVLKNEYTDWEKTIRNPLSSRDATLAFLSDGHTASSLIKLGYMHSLLGGRTYFLHFKHRTVIEEYPQRTGSVRGEDVPFWLGLPVSPLFPHNFTTQEKQISHLMLRYLSNFAKTGNPNLSASSSLLHTTTLTTSIAGAALKKLYDFQKIKRSTKVVNFTNVLSQREASLNLEIIYNQHRNNVMRDKKSYYRRNLRSNDGNESEIHFVDEKPQTGNYYEDEEMPFWNAYDVVNQLYLELGNKAKIQSHYRGHKLSMWLNLIPQLHRHFNINDQSMRHHQFQEDINSRDFYEGAVRPQLQTKPADEYEAFLVQPQRTTPSTSKTAKENKTTVEADSAKAGATSTECGIDGALYVSELTTMQAPKDNRTLSGPQKDLATASTGLIGNLEVLRRLGGKQFQSYTTALIATVAVGCFLLILNVLIFAGIYHQREKRARDAKTKEELQDSDTSKNSSLIKLNTLGVGSSVVHAGSGSSFRGGSLPFDNKTSVIFGEYSCYDEKTKQVKDEKLLVKLPDAPDRSLLLGTGTWAACSTSTLDLLKTKQTPISIDYTFNSEQTDIHMHPINQIEMASYNPFPTTTVVDEAGAIALTSTLTSTPQSKRGSFLDTSFSQPLGSHFDYAVQSSDQLSFKDIENAVKTIPMSNITPDDDIPEPPPPPRTFHLTSQPHVGGLPLGTASGGILRQSAVSNVNNASGGSSNSSKKRVHIQEITV